MANPQSCGVSNQTTVCLLRDITLTTVTAPYCLPAQIALLPLPVPSAGHIFSFPRTSELKTDIPDYNTGTKNSACNFT